MKKHPELSLLVPSPEPQNPLTSLLLSNLYAGSKLMNAYNAKLHSVIYRVLTVIPDLRICKT